MILLPASLTVTVVTSRTVVILIESRFGRAALFIVMLPRIGHLFARRVINILTAELFPAFPTPRFTAAGANKKSAAARLEPARENVITRSVFQAPTLTPRTLLCVRHPYLGVSKLN